MRILFDENVPLPLRQYFPGDDVTTVQRQGWSGIGNGELLDKAEGEFDVLVLADRNLRYQQNLSRRTIALVELPTNRWRILEAISAQVAAAVHAALPGSYTIVTP